MREKAVSVVSFALALFKPPTKIDDSIKIRKIWTPEKLLFDHGGFTIQYAPKRMDGWVRVLRPFNSISVISRRWKGEHERLCAMKRRLGSRRISPPAGFEPATPWTEVGSANRSATRTLPWCQRRGWWWWFAKWCPYNMSPKGAEGIANSVDADYMDQVMRKCVLWHMRTTKVQISLRIRAVWSAPLLFAA